jgi:hypothetical protein
MPVTLAGGSGKSAKRVGNPRSRLSPRDQTELQGRKGMLFLFLDLGVPGRFRASTTRPGQRK